LHITRVPFVLEKAMTGAKVAAGLGGRRTLLRVVRSEADLADAVQSGLPTQSADAVVQKGLLTPAELYRLVIPRRTLAHRKEKQRPLTAEQSDRLARVVRVVTRSEEALAGADKARVWLRTPNRALEGRAPLDLLDTDIGARMVERELVRIEHGIVS
jgi:putative toxin-antitoxin system antitoxin component (TIGR02293 family)